MAIPIYTPKFVKRYEYIDEEDGTPIVATFKADMKLFPLFKSLTGESLEVALANYRKDMLSLISDGGIDTLLEISKSDSEKQRELLMNNGEIVVKAFKKMAASKTYDEIGMTFVDALIVCMRVRAMPENDQVEALGLGTLIIPYEILTNPTTFGELIGMAFNFSDEVKKKRIPLK